jgi:hypothetical protein
VHPMRDVSKAADVERCRTTFLSRNKAKMKIKKSNTCIQSSRGKRTFADSGIGGYSLYRDRCLTAFKPGD